MGTTHPQLTKIMLFGALRDAGVSAVEIPLQRHAAVSEAKRLLASHLEQRAPGRSWADLIARSALASGDRLLGDDDIIDDATSFLAALPPVCGG